MSDPLSTNASRLRGAVAGACLFALLATGAIVSTPLAAHARGWFARHHWNHDHEGMRDHALVAASWLARRVDATDEQEEQLEEIVGRVVTDLEGLHFDRRAVHEAIIAELTAPSIDREALEELRAEQVAALEAASRTLVRAIADIGEVLTVEQRLELAELAAHRHRHRWHR